MKVFGWAVLRTFISILVLYCPSFLLFVEALSHENMISQYDVLKLFSLKKTCYLKTREGKLKNLLILFWEENTPIVDYLQYSSGKIRPNNSLSASIDEKSKIFESWTTSKHNKRL